MSYSPYPWLIKVVDVEVDDFRETVRQTHPLHWGDFSLGIVAQVNEPQLLPPEKPRIIATEVELVCAIFKGEHDVDNASLIALAPRMASLIEALKFAKPDFHSIFESDDQHRIRDEVDAIYAELHG